MILRAGARSDVGRRRAANEDRYAIAPEIGLYLVADGLGGHAAGQIASRVAAEAVLRTIRTLEGASTPLTEKLRYAMTAANREVFEAARDEPELAGMGTTLVVLLARDGRAAVAHVGDSRAYLVRGQPMRQLTVDHSLIGELLRRQAISAADARAHPHRHVLTRAVGVRPSVEPDLAELALEAGDVFVLCSDGLTGHVSDDEIAHTVQTREDPDEAIEALIALANERGGEDNITAVVVRCEKGERER